MSLRRGGCWCSGIGQVGRSYRLRAGARLIHAGRRSNWGGAAFLDLLAKLGELVMGKNRTGVKRFLDVAYDIGVFHQTLLKLSLNGDLIENSARVLRDLLKSANHRVGLLCQMKEDFDRGDVNCFQILESATVAAKPAFTSTSRLSTLVFTASTLVFTSSVASISL